MLSIGCTWKASLYAHAICTLAHLESNGRPAHTQIAYLQKPIRNAHWLAESNGRPGHAQIANVHNLFEIHTGMQRAMAALGMGCSCVRGHWP